MGITPIIQFLTATAILYSQNGFVTTNSGAITNERSYGEGKKIRCRFEGKSKYYQKPTGEVIDYNGIFYLPPNVDIKTNDKIEFNKKNYYIKNIEALYDFPNANLVHHYEVEVSDAEEDIPTQF